jgi:hypothetical protein
VTLDLRSMISTGGPAAQGPGPRIQSGRSVAARSATAATIGAILCLVDRSARPLKSWLFSDSRERIARAGPQLALSLARELLRLQLG